MKDSFHNNFEPLGIIAMKGPQTQLSKVVLCFLIILRDLKYFNLAKKAISQKFSHITTNASNKTVDGNH